MVSCTERHDIFSGTVKIRKEVGQGIGK